MFRGPEFWFVRDEGERKPEGDAAEARALAAPVVLPSGCVLLTPDFSKSRARARKR